MKSCAPLPRPSAVVVVLPPKPPASAPAPMVSGLPPITAPCAAPATALRRLKPMSLRCPFLVGGVVAANDGRRDVAVACVDGCQRLVGRQVEGHEHRGCLRLRRVLC